jgi:phosphodiesterase/alkaline phosphatase D-like protein
VNGNYQFITNNSTTGSVTIAAPASDCAIDVLWTNGAAITGAIIFSGFTVNATSAGAPTTAANAKFVISIRRINGISTYSVVPLQ